MKKDMDKFVFKDCTEDDFYSILDIQDEAFENLTDYELLRKNTPEMLRSCLKEPHVTLGVWYENELAAFSVLYYPDTDEENLLMNLDGVDCADMKSANYKLCIVRKDFWGNSLQYEMAERLLERAKESGVQVVCATASPRNEHSIRNIEKLGFTYNKTLEKYGYSRNLYYKFI